MNYTEKYHLPQWEETDRVMMTDFNQMCADMEAGLNANAQAAASALSAANSKPSSTAVIQAQNTANQALSAANAAQTAADNAYSPSKKPYAAGTYSGTGTQERSISVGFRPKMVLVMHRSPSSLNDLGVGVDGVTTFPITITSTGFSFVSSSYTNHGLNSLSSPYAYIAFR